MTRASLGCARCGACCQSIPMAGLDRMIEQRTAGERADDERWCADVDFMAAHWTRIAEGTEDRSPAYRCDQYDEVHMLCRVQEGKPPVCRDYPWYGKEPDVAHISALDPRCSYLLDVALSLRPEGARPLIPIEVIR